MKVKTIILVISVLITAGSAMAADDTPTTPSNRDERNAIRAGNKLYNERRYAEAEVEYKKALQYNPESEKATFNLALSYLRQGGTDDPNDNNSPLTKATQLLQNLVRTSNDEALVSRAYYNLGNIAFNQQKWDESIEMYKNTLRRNPDDDQARENLRLAQKKREEQQQNNQDQNQDQQQQDQNQNNEQNKEDQNQDQEQNQEQQQNQNQDNSQEQQDKQSISEANAEQILKAMQDAEKDTQQRVNAAKLQEEQATRRRTGNQW